MKQKKLIIGAIAGMLVIGSTITAAAAQAPASNKATGGSASLPYVLSNISKNSGLYHLDEISIKGEGVLSFDENTIDSVKNGEVSEVQYKDEISMPGEGSISLNDKNSIDAVKNGKVSGVEFIDEISLKGEGSISFDDKDTMDAIKNGEISEVQYKDEISKTGQGAISFDNSK